MLLWQATEVLEVPHFYFRHYFWSKYKAEKVAAITLELRCLHPNICAKVRENSKDILRQFGLGCIPPIFLKCFHVYFPPGTIVSSVIWKPNKILPLRSFFFLKCFINHSITVLCHEVIANWHVKKGIYMSSSPLSPYWARMTANLLVEILLNSSNKILFSASVIFSVTVSRLFLSKPI